MPPFEKYWKLDNPTCRVEKTVPDPRLAGLELWDFLQPGLLEVVSCNLHVKGECFSMSSILNWSLAMLGSFSRVQNLSSSGIFGSTCRIAQSRYPAAFKKTSTVARLLSAAHWKYVAWSAYEHYRQKYFNARKIFSIFQWPNLNAGNLEHQSSRRQHFGFTFNSCSTFRNSWGIAIAVWPGEKQGVGLQQADHGHQMQHGQHLVPGIWNGRLLRLKKKRVEFT